MSVTKKMRLKSVKVFFSCELEPQLEGQSCAVDFRYFKSETSSFDAWNRRYICNILLCLEKKKKGKSREKALEKRSSIPQQKYLPSQSLVRCNEEKRTISLNLCFLKFQLGLVLQTFSVHSFAVG